MAEHAVSAIEQKIIATIADISAIDPGILGPETSLVNDLSLDSLSLFEIVIELETFYDLRISDEEIESLKTIGEVVAFIADQLNQKK